MGGEHAQDPIADDQIGVERRARLVIRNREVDRAGGGDREAGQDRVGEAPAMLLGPGPEDHPATRRLGEISRLIGVEPGSAADADLLQTGDVGIDFVQHGGDPRRVVAPVDADAAMDVVGDHLDRGQFACRDARMRATPRSSAINRPSVLDGSVEPHRSNPCADGRRNRRFATYGAGLANPHRWSTMSKLTLNRLLRRRAGSV